MHQADTHAPPMAEEKKKKKRLPSARQVEDVIAHSCVDVSPPLFFLCAAFNTRHRLVWHRQASCRERPGDPGPLPRMAPIYREKPPVGRPRQDGAAAGRKGPACSTRALTASARARARRGSAQRGRACGMHVDAKFATKRSEKRAVESGLDFVRIRASRAIPMVTRHSNASLDSEPRSSIFGDGKRSANLSLTAASCYAGRTDDRHNTCQAWLTCDEKAILGTGSDANRCNLHSATGWS